MAGIELGRRVCAAAGGQVSVKISGSDDAIEFCKSHFSRLAADTTHEEFHIVTLDTKNKVIQSHHPSGDPTPSREDIQVTDRLTESGKLLGIDVLDHIVLGRENAISIRAN